MTVPYPKRLIEVDLPIKRISAHARREKSIRHGHISTLHVWWARRPLAACRGVILAALWPDPADGNCPDRFRTEARERMLRWARDRPAKVSAESFERLLRIQKDSSVLDDPLELRKCLLDFIADFADWDNSNDPAFLETSRALVQVAHEALGGPPGTRPLIVDPFAGGGSIPLEALRVGAAVVASDVNPIPVLLNRLLLECGNGQWEALRTAFRSAASEVRSRAEAFLAPAFRTESGRSPVAYIWARTVRCAGPSCGVEFPLLRTMRLSQQGPASAWLNLRPRRAGGRPTLTVALVHQPSQTGAGTVKGGGATCPVCGFSMTGESVRSQLSERHGGSRDASLLAVLDRDPSGQKRFRLPGKTDEAALLEVERLTGIIADTNDSDLPPFPDEAIPPERPSPNARGLSAVTRIGMTRFEDLYTPRQALVLAAFAKEVRAVARALRDQGSPHAAAVAVLLAAAVSKRADFGSSLCSWRLGASCVRGTFARQALTNTWDFGEMSPFAGSAGDWNEACEYIDRFLGHLSDSGIAGGTVLRASAVSHPLPDDACDAVITDPPYYDSVPYADLSEFFHVWLRRCLSGIIQVEPLAPAKDDEIIWNPSRVVKGQAKDEQFYEEMMTRAFSEARRITKPEGIQVVVFAHKSTAGWEAILEGLVAAGWVATGSWPLDTERAGRTNSVGTASLGSSVHVVCRPRENPDGSVRTDAVGDWRDILAQLPNRIHQWMPRLAEEGIVGADAIFACLGPALEIFSRYTRVEKASGAPVTLKEYLEHVWAAVAKEALSMIFSGAETSGFEEDARLTAMWLWTLSTSSANGKTEINIDNEGEDSDDKEDDGKTGKNKPVGFALEYDAARKIAQGLGAHLEQLTSLVEVKGDTARLLPVAERTRALFGKSEADAPAGRRKRQAPQMKIAFADELEEAEEAGGWGQKGAPQLGETVLDRLHQSMILFAAGRGEALRRFLVDEGAGRDGRFWRLAQALAALYPTGTDERRWVEGVLARKKGLGF